MYKIIFVLCMLLFIYSIVIFFITRKWKKGLKNGETTRYHGNIILQYTYEYLTVDTRASHVYLFAENTFLN